MGNFSYEHFTKYTPRWEAKIDSNEGMNILIGRNDVGK